MTLGRLASTPFRVGDSLAELPLHDTDSSRLYETAALKQADGGSLMAKAGAAVARWVLALHPHARRVWVAAGPGGNGGDGVHAAAHLARMGLQVSVTLFGDLPASRADIAQGLGAARPAGVQFVEGVPPAGCDVTVDAVLGLGARRAPSGRVAEGIGALNGAGVPCLSVDLPSGLNGSTGALLGDVCVRAQATLSLVTLKPGLFTAHGRDCAGEIWFQPLVGDPDGCPPPVAWLSSRATCAKARPTRRHSQHKGSFGDVVLVGADRGMAGALRLAAEATLRAGAGRTILSPLDPALPLWDGVRPEWLWRSQAWNAHDGSLERSTVVCGCGGGPAVREPLPALLSRSARLVLDADALNAIAADEGLLRQLRARSDRSAPTVLTPHPLEAARLLGTTVDEVQHDRFTAALTLVERTRCVVVLKGSGTLIASPGHRPVVNPTGHAGLGSGGTGDVLAGWIGGLWSASMADRSETDAAGSEPQAALHLAGQVAAAAVWQHGHAADLRPGQAVLAGELAHAMAQAMAGN